MAATRGFGVVWMLENELGLACIENGYCTGGKHLWQTKSVCVATGLGKFRGEHPHCLWCAKCHLGLLLLS